MVKCSLIFLRPTDDYDETPLWYVPFRSATWPRQRLMPRPASSRDRGSKVAAQQRTERPRAGLVRRGRRLSAVCFTATSVAGGPRSLSTSPCPTTSSAATCPATVRAASARREQRPDCRELRGLTSGCARPPLPCPAGGLLLPPYLPAPRAP